MRRKSQPGDSYGSVTTATENPPTVTESAVNFTLAGG
jgi:hypothetical protein